MLLSVALYITMLVSSGPTHTPPYTPHAWPSSYAAAYNYGYGYVYPGYGYAGIALPHDWPNRACEAVNQDGICVSWSSTLRGVDLRRFPVHAGSDRRRVKDPVVDVPPAEANRPFEPQIIDLVPFNKASAIPGAR